MTQNNTANSAGSPRHVRNFRDRAVETFITILKVMVILCVLAVPPSFVRVCVLCSTQLALIAASPVPWVFMWSQLGVPPNRSFAYYCIYLVLLILAIRFNK